MRKTIVFEGGVDNIRTLADNSLRVSLGTPELSPETVGNLYSVLKQPGFVVLSSAPISEKQIEAHTHTNTCAKDACSNV